MAGHDVSVIGHTATAVGIGALLVERYDVPPPPVLCNGATPELGGRAAELARGYDMQVLEPAITEVLGDPKAGLVGYRLADGTMVETPRSFVSLGIIAYNELLTALGGKVDASGKAVVSETCESSVANVFVVGDLVAGKKMQIYTGWDVAVDAADEINRRLRSEKRKARLA